MSDPVLSRSSRSHHLESSVVQDLEPATPAPSSSIIVSCWGVGATSEAGHQGRQAAAPTASWGGMGEHWSGVPTQGRGAQGAKLSVDFGGSRSEAHPHPHGISVAKGFYRRPQAPDPHKIPPLSQRKWVALSRPSLTLALVWQGKLGWKWPSWGALRRAKEKTRAVAPASETVSELQ